MTLEALCHHKSADVRVRAKARIQRNRELETYVLSQRQTKQETKRIASQEYRQQG